MSVDDRLRHWAETNHRRTELESMDAHRYLDVGERRPRSHRGLLLVAAAAVVAAVAATAALVHSDRDTAPSAQSSAGSPSTSPATSARPSTHAATRVLPATVGGWGARRLGNQTLLPYSLVAGARDVYGLEGRELVRISPVTGSVLARASVSTGSRPVMAAGSVWAPDVAGSGSTGSSFRLIRYDAITLRPTGSVTVPGVAGIVPTVVTDPGGTTIYVGAGTSLTIVDAAKVAVRTTVTTADPIVSLSATGSTLYVGCRTPDLIGTLSRVEVRNAYSGVRQMTRLGGPLLQGDDGLFASDGGVWIAIAGGMQESTTFVPNGSSTTGTITAEGESGAPAVPYLTERTAWIGQLGRILCADPDTGRLRAYASLGTARLPGRAFMVVPVGNRLVATYQPQSGQPGLITLNPPAACG